MMAVVQSEDAGRLCKRLNAEGYRVTRINSAGGFLARGNVTILAGVDDDRLESVLNSLRAVCRTRKSYINAMPWGVDAAQFTLSAPAPMEVEVGGAAVFTLPVKRFVRIQARDPLRHEATERVLGSADAGSTPSLVLAVVQDEDATSVTQGLLAAGHRLTRIDTAGAFRKRGNATLLIGAAAGEVDDVLDIIEARCRALSKATPSGADEEAHCATIFVLEASEFMRV